MVRLQKLYSKFTAIESGRGVTEVTKGSCCGRRDRWRQLSAIRLRNLQHTVESVLPAPTSACCAHSTEGALGRDRLGYSPAVDGFHGLFRHARAKAGSTA